MESCEEIANKYFPKEIYETKVYDYVDTCVIDFRDKSLTSDVKDIVQCDIRCEVEEEDYDECVKECEENVVLATTGSIEIDKKTGRIRSSTIPVNCSIFYEEEDWEFGFSEKKERELLSKLYRLGCVECDIGWMHPHEFMPHPTEWEEEPAICYIHIKSSAEGKCLVPDVLKTLETV